MPGRDLRIVEEDLGEGLLVVQLLDRSHRHARRVEGNENEGETPVTGRVRIRPEHSEEPVGEGSPAGPGLLAVDHVVVAIANRSGLDVRHVGAGVRLGPALGPDLLGGGHLRQEAALLLGSADLHDRRSEQEDAVLVDAPGGADPVVLLLEDQPLEQVRSPPTVLDRPGHHREAPGMQLLLPGAVGLEAFAGVEGGELLAGGVGLEPASRLLAKGLLLGGVGQVHGFPRLVRSGPEISRTSRRASRRRRPVIPGSPARCRARA